MKRFLINILWFLGPLIVIYYSKPYYLLHTGNYQDKVAGAETYSALRVSKKKCKAKKVLLGDSVAKQFFKKNNDTDTIANLTCNQAISAVGHYLLLRNYVQNNDVDTVYMLFNPLSFKNDLDQKFTFNYFLKPFNNNEYQQQFSAAVQDRIERIPYHFLSQEWNVRTSNWTPDHRSSGLATRPVFSTISKEYLNKIKALCDEQRIQIIMLSPPIPEGDRKRIEAIPKDDLTATGMRPALERYLDALWYLPDSTFSDGTHLKDPAVYADRSRRMMQ